jgi:phosphoglycerate kinase
MRSVIVLENLRFYPGEEANDPEFAKQLAKASGARYFVQDGFGVVHRAHASTVAITHQLPSVAGLLLEREYTTITDAMKSPKRPLVTVLGGAKVSDKIKLIQAFIGVSDTIFIGGAMANTFFAYKGYLVGKSKHEPGMKPTLDAIYEAARDKVGVENVDNFLVLPSDVAVGKSLEKTEPRRTVSIRDVATDDYILDIGETSIDRAVALVKGAQTVIWNGTLGITELLSFAKGSAEVAQALATHPDTTSIIGGGDTASFVINWDAKRGASFTDVSTGGGASLALMAGEKLPGVQSLLDARPQVRYTNKKEA